MSRIFTLNEAQIVLPVVEALLKRAQEAGLRAGEIEAEIESNIQASDTLRAKVANTPAHTLTGRQAKAWALLDERGLGHEGDFSWK